jgi:DNA-binding helix-turn-helix protein
MKNKIAEYRRKQGLTQSQLAEKCSLASYVVVQRYERETRTPTVDTAIRIARALNATVEEIFVVDD